MKTVPVLTIDCRQLKKFHVAVVVIKVHFALVPYQSIKYGTFHTKIVHSFPQPIFSLIRLKIYGSITGCRHANIVTSHKKGV